MSDFSRLDIPATSSSPSLRGQTAEGTAVANPNATVFSKPILPRLGRVHAVKEMVYFEENPDGLLHRIEYLEQNFLSWFVCK